MAWRFLQEEIAEEFAQEPPSMHEQAHYHARADIHYRLWSARENERLPPELRKRVESLAKSAARRAWAKQVETEQEEKQPKKRKPRGAPPAALTRYQKSHQKRKAAMREKLLVDRDGVTHHFTIFSQVITPNGTEVEEIKGYITANCYDDDNKRLGEIFVTLGKPGSKTSWVDQWAIQVSLGLQYGIPVDEIFKKHVHAHFEPFGASSNPAVGYCTSIIDYISRWCLLEYGSKEMRQRLAKPKLEEVLP